MGPTHLAEKNVNCVVMRTEMAQRKRSHAFLRDLIVVLAINYMKEDSESLEALTLQIASHSFKSS